MQTIRTLLALASGVLVFGAVPVDAATWYVDQSATGANDGTSWADAFTSLRAAVLASGDADEIWVTRGTYFATDSNDPTEVLTIPANVKVLGGFVGGELSAAERPADSDPATADPAEDTIISGELGAPGSADNSRRLVFISGSNERVVLDRLVLSGAANALAAGGAVQISGFSDQPTLFRDCLIVSNSAQAGGAVNVTTGRLTAERCIFRDNSATQTGVQGGAVAMTGSVGVFTDCVFESNRAVSGAAALEAEATTLTVAACAFRDNTCSARAVGGAVRVGSRTTQRQVTITDCDFIENGGNTLPPEDCQGGAIRIDRNSVVISGCSFQGNFAEGGGAVSVWGGSVRIERSTFDENVAVYGGALSMIAFSTDFMGVSDCTFERGYAVGGGGGGGGAYFCAGGRAEFDRCDFLDNDSYWGGAMLLGGGRCTARECVFNGNSADLAGAVYVYDLSEAPQAQEFARCVFSANRATVTGGGAVASEFSGIAQLRGCVLYGNSAAGFGGGVICRGPALLAVANCTIEGNSAAATGGARGVGGGLTIVNSIVRGNAAGQVSGATGVTYSNVQGGASGAGNIDAVPSYAGVHDYRLLAGSPGIDAGDNAGVPSTLTTDLFGSIRKLDDPSTPDSGAGTAPIVDMGAFEFDASAPALCPADANGDGQVNGADLSIVLAGFGGVMVPGQGADLNGDGLVDGRDLSVLLAAFGSAC